MIAADGSKMEGLNSPKEGRQRGESRQRKKKKRRSIKQKDEVGVTKYCLRRRERDVTGEVQRSIASIAARADALQTDPPTVRFEGVASQFVSSYKIAFI